MLRRIELEVLATVDRGDTISELATKLDKSESYLSRAVGDLAQKGLVYRRSRASASESYGNQDFRDDERRSLSNHLTPRVNPVTIPDLPRKTNIYKPLFLKEVRAEIADKHSGVPT